MRSLEIDILCKDPNLSTELRWILYQCETRASSQACLPRYIVRYIMMAPSKLQSRRVGGREEHVSPTAINSAPIPNLSKGLRREKIADQSDPIGNVCPRCLNASIFLLTPNQTLSKGRVRRPSLWKIPQKRMTMARYPTPWSHGLALRAQRL